MKRYALVGLLAAVVLAGPTGCNKELNELRTKTQQLESDLKFARGNLADREKELTDAKTRVAQLDADYKAEAKKYTETKIAYDKAKKELNACRKRLKP
jgi:chromosome segregation ATPase